MIAQQQFTGCKNTSGAPYECPRRADLSDQLPGVGVGVGFIAGAAGVAAGCGGAAMGVGETAGLAAGDAAGEGVALAVLVLLAFLRCCRCVV
jgi:hypothetical protein